MARAVNQGFNTCILIPVLLPSGHMTLTTVNSVQISVRMGRRLKIEASDGTGRTSLDKALSRQCNCEHFNLPVRNMMRLRYYFARLTRYLVSKGEKCVSITFLT